MDQTADNQSVGGNLAQDDDREDPFDFLCEPDRTRNSFYYKIVSDLEIRDTQRRNVHVQSNACYESFYLRQLRPHSNIGIEFARRRNVILSVANGLQSKPKYLQLHGDDD